MPECPGPHVCTECSEDVRHGAAAFAYGHDIVLGAGVHNTPSALMAEEVVHVVQQRGATTPSAPAVSSPNSGPEVAARRASSAVLSGRRARVGGVTTRAVMRVERDRDQAGEEHNPKDLSPQLGSFESRSDEELAQIVNDDKGLPRFPITSSG